MVGLIEDHEVDRDEDGDGAGTDSLCNSILTAIHLHFDNSILTAIKREIPDQLCYNKFNTEIIQARLWNVAIQARLWYVAI